MRPTRVSRMVSALVIGLVLISTLTVSLQPSAVERWIPSRTSFTSSKATLDFSDLKRASTFRFGVWRSRLFYSEGRSDQEERNQGAKTTSPVFFQSDKKTSLTREDETLREEAVVESEPKQVNKSKSFIREIVADNLAGVTATTHPDDAVSKAKGDDSTVRISLDPHLVAVTGETGSGKSLLLGTAAKLAVGGKASASLLSLSGEETRVELEVQLHSPHLEYVQSLVENAGLSPNILYKEGDEPSRASESALPSAALRLSRALSLEVPQKGLHDDDDENKTSQRLKIKSVCTINGQPVNLSTLRSVGQPILTAVDASAASSALSRPSSRMAIVDCAVPPTLLSHVRRARNAYRSCRRVRENLEAELNQRILPPSYQGRSGDHDEEEVLRHWVEELDDFQQQMEGLRERATSVLVDSSIDTAKKKKKKTKKKKATNMASKGGRQGPKSLPMVAREFASSFWGLRHESGQTDGSENTDFYTCLLDFRDAVRALDGQLDHARAARESLASLSSPDSALLAVEKARSHLFDIGGNVGDAKGVSSLADAIEQSHDLLNAVEVALAQCAKSIEGEGGGDALIEVLQSQRDEVNLTPEEIDEAVSGWNTLARKHGVSPYALTACHASLRAELDGNAEAKARLPRAQQEEEDALDEFAVACAALTEARELVSERLTSGVSSWLPQLGMEGSRFRVALRRRDAEHEAIKDDISSSSISASVLTGPTLGVDTVDFMLHNRKSTKKNHRKKDRNSEINDSEGFRRDDDEQEEEVGWGRVDAVASSGERARILLAIETEMPGSVGASCGNGNVDGKTMLSPVTVLYDEIDAHMGGRAAVAVARLLSDQGRNGNGGQVISITHSASVAAVADQHIVVHKTPPPRSEDGSDTDDIDMERSEEATQNDAGTVKGFLRMSVRTVKGAQRRKELARMASGDVATKEAEIFADALIREGKLRREENYARP